MLDTKSTFDDDRHHATRPTTTRPSGSWPTASTATSPARSRARRSTWRWRSSTSCTTETRLRPRRGRHAADAPRARLHRRPATPHPLPRPPPLPGAHRTDPRRDEGGERRRAGLHPHGRKVVGADVFDDAIAFFQAFEGMEEGFKERAKQVLELLIGRRAPRSCSSPHRGATPSRRPRFFADKLGEGDLPVRALDREPHAPAVR